MEKRYKIALDPFLLCLPENCHSEKQIEQFLQNLLLWSDCFNRPNYEIILSDNCRCALIEDKKYPYEHYLRELLRKFSIDYMDHETISQLVRFILERAPSYDVSCGISIVIYNEDSYTIEPKFYIERLAHKTQIAFADTLITLIIYNMLGAGKGNQLVLASAESEEVQENTNEIHVSSEIHDIEWGENTTPSLITLPTVISDTLNSYTCYNDYIGGLGYVELWQREESEKGLAEAINYFVDELIRNGSAQHGSKIKYSFGHNFIESLKRWDFNTRSDYASVLIETCARIIIRKPKNELKPFRVDVSSNATQRVRNDGASAFRTHLTKKGPGFRLMLWEITDEEIEFANVGDKDELCIF